MSGEAQAQLCEAIEAGDLETVQKLYRKALQYGSLLSIFEDNYDGHRPLHYACTQGNLEIVKFLVETCEVPNDQCSKYKVRPIDMAIFNDNLDIVKYLVESCKVSLTKCNKNGQTPAELCRKYNAQRCQHYIVARIPESNKPQTTNETPKAKASQDKKRSREVQVIPKMTQSSAARVVPAQAKIPKVYVSSEKKVFSPEETMRKFAQKLPIRKDNIERTAAKSAIPSAKSNQLRSPTHRSRAARAPSLKESKKRGDTDSSRKVDEPAKKKRKTKEIVTVAIDALEVGGRETKSSLGLIPKNRSLKSSRGLVDDSSCSSDDDLPLQVRTQHIARAFCSDKR